VVLVLEASLDSAALVVQLDRHSGHPRPPSLPPLAPPRPPKRPSIISK